MRRYSQRHNLGTLAELNVTPLLDLAFVLLIIFMITTPLMEKNVDVVLPTTNGAPGAAGPPQEAARDPASITGPWLAEHLGLGTPARG